MLRRALAAGAAVAVLMSALVACSPQEQRVVTTTVGGDGFEISLDGVEASADAGVAPEGTTVTLKLAKKQAAGGLSEHTTALASSVSLTLGDGLQPEKPIDLRFHINEDEITDGEWAAPESLLIATQSDDGTVGLLGTSRDGEFLTAQTDHLSLFQPVQLNFNSVVKRAKDFVMQSLGLEMPEPDCLGEVANAATGAAYSIAYRGWIHPCISTQGDTITVDLYSASMMPFRATAEPLVTGRTMPSPDTQGFLAALLNNSPSLTDGTILGGGSFARFQFSTTAPPTHLDARQDAHMLLGAVMLNVLAVVVKPLGALDEALEKLGQLDCLSGIVTTSLSDKFDAKTAAEMWRATLTCAGTLEGFSSYSAKLALAAIGAVPAWFAGVFVGIYNELSGQQTVRIDVESSVTPWTISPDGIGPFRVGKTTWDDVESLPKFEGDASNWSDIQCTAGGWYNTETIYDGVSVLVSGTEDAPGALDVVVLSGASRSYVAETVPAKTSEGLALDSTVEDVKRLYPSATARPNALSDSITEYRVQNSSGRAMVIGVESKHVSYIAVGSVPEVDYPEGCA